MPIFSAFGFSGFPLVSASPAAFMDLFANFSEFGGEELPTAGGFFSEFGGEKLPTASGFFSNIFATGGSVKLLPVLRALVLIPILLLILGPTAVSPQNSEYFLKNKLIFKNIFEFYFLPI